MRNLLKKQEKVIEGKSAISHPNALMLTHVLVLGLKMRNSVDGILLGHTVEPP